VNVWEILGILATGDEREIKRAYARRLKLTRPDDDVKEFLELREAYEAALRHARVSTQQESDIDAPRDAREHASIEAGAPVPAPVFHAPLWENVLDERYANHFPGDDALQLWDQFVKEAGQAPKRILQKLEHRGLSHDLAVRDLFELYAVRHCAQDNCEEKWREALSEHFRWEFDSNFIRRQLPNETRTMFLRLRALRNERAFNRLSMASYHDEAIGVLLGTHKVSRWKTFDKNFLTRLREVAGLIRSEHVELLYDRLDYLAFERWEAIANSRRYFRQHAIVSALTGFVVWFCIVSHVVRDDSVLPDMFVLLIATQVIALLCGAGLVLQFGRTRGLS
jgi:hypothetical protein